MYWMDWHCDVLWKMWKQPGIRFYPDDERLMVSHAKLQQSGSVAQVFAIFVPPEVPPAARFHACLEQVDLFYQQILRDGKDWILFRQAEDMEAARKGNKRLAILSLEGGEALQGEVMYLRQLHRLGVCLMGLTWNWRNELADGVMEPHAAGLTRKGREVLQEMKLLNIPLDLSHLSEASFWDLLSHPHPPVFSSHANVYEIHPHRRNLKREQIRAILDEGGFIGLTFVADFVSSKSRASLSDWVKHLEEVCALGGVQQVGIGSDFDGTDRVLSEIPDAGAMEALGDYLCRYYTHEQVQGFLADNGLCFLRRAV